VSRVRTVLLVLGALVGVVAAGTLAAAAWVLLDMPGPQGERLRGPHGLVGIQAGGSYSWVVPSDGGVLLIDAGQDPLATALRREIGGRTVQAVVLTHGHADHVAGLAGLPEVPVVLGPDQLPLVCGERQPGGWLAGWLAALTTVPALPEDVRHVADGDTVVLDGVTLRAVHMPGHTLGSTAWLWEDVAFTGDALLGGRPPTLAPAALSTDPARAEESLAALLDLDFDWLADGHSGLTTGARSEVHLLLGEPPVPAKVSVRSSDGTASVEDVRHEGLYQQAPAGCGRQEALLVLDDGRQLLLSRDPIAAHRPLWGRRVVAAGRLEPLEPRPARPAGLLLADAEVTLVPGQEGGDGTLPVIRDAASAAAWMGRWVRAELSVDPAVPLAHGAAWGVSSASLQGDGTAVRVIGPCGSSDADRVVVGRLQSDPTGAITLVADVACELPMTGQE